MKKNRIESICKVLEEIGPSSARAINARLPDIDVTSIHTYCTRAVEKRLIFVTKQSCKYGDINIYSVVQDSKPAPKNSWNSVSSVFGIKA